MIQDTAGDLLPENLICKVPIHHYTSARGFLGIIESHSLRATEAFGLNDVAELRHGWSFVRAWLSKQADDDVVSVMNLHTPDDGDVPDDPVFMCCASTMPDDASQWRLYADATRGYVIEIDPNMPLAVLARMEAFPNRRPPGKREPKQLGAIIRDFANVSPWIRVMYTEKQKTAALDSYKVLMQDRFAEYDKEMSSAPTAMDYDLLRQDRDGEVRAGLATLAQCMKAEAFAGELEVRAVATLLEDDHCHFRDTTYGVVRHVELGTGREGESYNVSTADRSPLPITGVGLGPGQVAQNSREAARSALKRFGYRVSIRESSATIR